MPYRTLPSEAIMLSKVNTSLNNVIKFILNQPAEKFSTDKHYTGNHYFEGLKVSIANISLIIFKSEDKKIFLAYLKEYAPYVYVFIPGVSWWQKFRLSMKLRSIYRFYRNQGELKRREEVISLKRNKILAEYKIKKTFLSEIGSISDIKLLK